MWFRALICAVWALGLASGASAEGKRFTLTADPVLVEDGFLKFLMPRFSLKTGVRIALGEGGAMRIGSEGETPVLVRDGAVFAASIDDTAPGADHAGRFLDWLGSDIGLKTIESYAKGPATYGRPEIQAAAVEAEAPVGDVVLGEKVSLRKCGRCHVVNKKNRFGGIGSTPSFGALRTLPRWRERFEAFWTLNPHPAFTQVEGITPPFDPQRPPPIAPLELSLEEVDAILAFVVTMKPKDLGGPLIAN